MYAKRIQLINYGPIERLDIAFPFEGATPKPVLLVGENGSGKSILLSHLVNGLLSAQGIAYPETPEVKVGKLYKLRSSSYIKLRSEVYFARVDFAESLYVEELRARRPKQDYSDTPADLSEGAAPNLWRKMKPEDKGQYSSNFPSEKKAIESIFSKNCVLYFPPNRFEEPAWLNEENLNARAQYVDLKHFQGYTSRKVINYSPLHDNQNWLFDVVYDRTVFEAQSANYLLSLPGSTEAVSRPVIIGHFGNATQAYDIALQVVRGVMRSNRNARFGVGRRAYRVLSVMEKQQVLVHNIFQMSTGETSLLNLFISILRDFDLSGAPFQNPEDIRGVVVVDEIDLHLHSNHQYNILPNLMQMFPKVQFIVTTHSPLFVLGLKNILGEGGFALYQLPGGQQISPEEFSEFGSAYQSFTETRKFSEDIRRAIEESHKPIVFVEGKTDVKYLQKAAEFLDQQAMLAEIQLKDAGGSGDLNKIWKNFKSKLSEITLAKIILLYDCEELKCDSRGQIYQRHVPRQNDHPLIKGIENLFSQTTLEKARIHDDAFIDEKGKHKTKVRGLLETVPEEWTINPDEKTNLCNWLCKNGTAEDFQHFQVVFDLLGELLNIDPPILADQSTDQVQHLTQP